MAVARRARNLFIALILLAVAAACGAVLAMPFDTEFADIPIQCEAVAVEAWPERRPKPPGADEVTYAELTRDPRVIRGYRSDLVRYFEAKACGSEARRRALIALPVGLISLLLVPPTLRSALRRRNPYALGTR